MMASQYELNININTGDGLIGGKNELFMILYSLVLDFLDRKSRVMVRKNHYYLKVGCSACFSKRSKECLGAGVSLF